MRLVSVVGVLAIGMTAPMASAHHSPTMFDISQELEITGTVRQFQWANPHCYIQLIAEDGQEWNFEMAAPYGLMSQGWTRQTLRSGDEIRITYSPLRRGGNNGLVVSVETLDGQPVGGQG
jgi:hypothetical protein